MHTMKSLQHIRACAAHRLKGCFGGCMPSLSSTPSIQSALSTSAYTMLSGVACTVHSTALGPFCRIAICLLLLSWWSPDSVSCHPLFPPHNLHNVSVALFNMHG